MIILGNKRGILIDMGGLLPLMDGYTQGHIKQDVLLCVLRTIYFRTRYRGMLVPMVLSSGIYIDSISKNP